MDLGFLDHQTDSGRFDNLTPEEQEKFLKACYGEGNPNKSGSIPARTIGVTAGTIPFDKIPSINMELPKPITLPYFYHSEKERDEAVERMRLESKRNKQFEYYRNAFENPETAGTIRRKSEEELKAEFPFCTMISYDWDEIKKDLDKQRNEIKYYSETNTGLIGLTKDKFIIIT